MSYHENRYTSNVFLIILIMYLQNPTTILFYVFIHKKVQLLLFVKNINSEN
jgi:hypothetical protein